ncbi:L10-interacting MYB domain-containing protein-like [Lactuca sativa]|uniref:L10-interacting MYB domain-containing protein-like n=1 Tax=Lactuca sativa TaxID=4236 RepID=UPI0022AE9392|nr:L10-interacting MYB domain-containing protein-like [Lactuca sativa]
MEIKIIFDLVDDKVVAVYLYSDEDVGTMKQLRIKVVAVGKEVVVLHPWPTAVKLKVISCEIESYDGNVGLEQYMKNFLVYKLMLVWTESEDKTFLDACIHELTTNGLEGSGLKATSWKIVRKKLINEHGKEVDQKQMRNHFDYYKSKYVAWAKLKNKTGNIYDHIKNKFNLTDEQWKEEGNLNKYVLSLKTRPLLFPDLCTQLFEGSTSTGFQSWGPSSTVPRPVEEFSAHDFDDDVPMETSTQHKLVETKELVGKRDARALEVEEEIVKLARSLVEKNERIEKSEMDKDVDACMEKMNKMEWGEEDERYKTALCYLVKVLMFEKFGYDFRILVVSRG